MWQSLLVGLYSYHVKDAVSVDILLSILQLKRIFEARGYPLVFGNIHAQNRANLKLFDSFQLGQAGCAHCHSKCATSSTPDFFKAENKRTSPPPA